MILYIQGKRVNNMGGLRKIRRRMIRTIMTNVNNSRKRLLKTKRFQKIQKLLTYAVGGLLSGLFMQMSFTASVNASLPYRDIAKKVVTKSCLMKTAGSSNG